MTTFAVAAMLAAAGCSDVLAIGAERHDRQDFPFSGERLTIDNHSADLRIVSGTGDTVEVERSLTGKATGGGNAAWALEDGTLTLSVTCSGVVPDCGGHHVVRVPAGIVVEVTSHGGPVRAVGLAGDLTATVEDAWLRVEDPAGVLRLNASFTVDVTGSRSADVTATSAERDVVLSFATPPAAVAATAGEGSVRITLPEGDEAYRVTATSAAGEVDATVPRDPTSDRTIVAETEHGDIRIHDTNQEG